MISEIIIFKVKLMKSIKILEFDENLHFHEILFAFDKISNQITRINDTNF